VLFFKAEDQGVDAMQGDSCRVISHDEEGGSEAVWNEAEVRLWDQKGWHLMANTPIKGRTWIYHRFVKDTPPDAACYWIHTLDNPFLPQEDARKLERMNTAIAAARLRGEFVQLKGRVWPAFSRGVHVVNRPTIPPDWPRYRSIDFGTRNPFVCLWGALDPDDTLWVYREHYQAGWTTSQHVEAIRGAEGWRRLDDGEAPPRVGAVLRSEWGTWVDDGSHEPIENTWADPEDPQQIAQLSMNHDLFITPAVRDVAAGIDAVAERLGARAIVVSSECANTIREIEGYAWSEQAENTERPLKRDDHTCDCVRYLCMGVLNE
jgi:phage terminase large subunit